MGTSQRVADVMTTGVATCSMDDNIKAVMAEMTRRRFRHLPVIENGRLAGIVSIGDVVKSRLGEMELETVMLREAYIAAH
jgi:CBS domain-containing protein